jgi:DNA-directed RNA polymerase subunit RPC12/RpoP
VKGTQHRIVCPSCGKAFFAWRPDELPGAPVKCYFCGKSFEDEAAKRKRPEAPAPAAAPAADAAAAAPAPAGPAPAAPAPGPADPAVH